MGASLRTSELEDASMLNAHPAGVIVLDAGGVLIDLNDAASDLLSRSREELSGLRISDILDEPSAERFERHLKDVAAGGIERCELMLDGRDGPDSAQSTVLLVQTRADEDGEGSETFRSILVDVTTYVDRAVAAEEGERAAERVARSKTDFLARLSHELKSALASMVGFAEMLRGNAEDESHELAEIITVSGRHLLDTLNSVMDLAQIEYNDGEIDLNEIDVVHRVRERVMLFRSLGKTTDVELDFRAEVEDAVACLNGTFIDRVVHNLIDNAIKYTPEGKIEVTVEEHDDRVWIYVADTGVGIDEKFMPRLFSPFEREVRGPENAADGVGLGLTITKYLVELMGGTIFACSTAGEGSTFTVSFPVPEREAKGEEA